MKKALSVLLAMLFVCSALTVAVHAAPTEAIHVYDLLKHDADSKTGMCRTIEIFFEIQFKHYDVSKTITFQTADGTVVANCVPRSDNNHMMDLYTPDGQFGAVLDPTRLYYLMIPEGAYFTDIGILNAEYCGEYNGIYLSDMADKYSSRDLGITNFLAGQTEGKKLFHGKLLFSSSFASMLQNKDVVLLYRIEDGKDILVGTFSFSTSGFKAGLAEITFGGVEIDQYASYKLHVQYGAFLAGTSVVNAHSDYLLSGKKLLGLSESYPVIDFLIAAFGADHWTLTAVDYILKALTFIKVVDKALYNDVKAYIKARK